MSVNLYEFHDTFKTEKDCFEYLIQKRWKGKPVCPHCKSDKCCVIKTRLVLKCKCCKKQFSVRKGTMLEDSRLPLKKWFFAIFLVTSLKKGISSVQLGKYIGVTQKTAWFMLHRIRKTLGNQITDNKLSNVVEADETYVGGKPRWRGISKRGRGTTKAPVIGVVERSGNVRCMAVKKVDAKTLTGYIQSNVEEGAHMITDEYKSYKSLPKLGYTHEVIEHAKKVYVDGHIHTNTIEGFWSHLKRGINGIYIKVSKKHLNNYCDEFCYRYNTKDMNDEERFSDCFGYMNGTRLTYLSLVTSLNGEQKKVKEKEGGGEERANCSRTGARGKDQGISKKK